MMMMKFLFLLLFFFVDKWYFVNKKNGVNLASF